MFCKCSSKWHHIVTHCTAHFSQVNPAKAEPSRASKLIPSGRVSRVLSLVLCICTIPYMDPHSHIPHPYSNSSHGSLFHNHPPKHTPNRAGRRLVDDRNSGDMDSMCITLLYIVCIWVGNISELKTLSTCVNVSMVARRIVHSSQIYLMNEDTKNFVRQLMHSSLHWQKQMPNTFKPEHTLARSSSNAVVLKSTKFLWHDFRRGRMWNVKF